MPIVCWPAITLKGRSVREWGDIFVTQYQRQHGVIKKEL